MTDQHARTRTGLLLGLGAYLSWGVLPLYFKALAHVPPSEIVAHRIVWSLLFLAALITLGKRWAAFRRALSQPRLMLILCATALLIAVNWLVFIWAIAAGHVLGASLG